MVLNGGKSYLAKRIVALMPRHLHYVESFAGGLAVLLERDPNDKGLWASECTQRGGVSELINDLNGELTNFWRVLQHEKRFPEFLRIVQAVPLSRSEFDGANQPHDPGEPVLSAANFFIRARQSRAGGFKGFTSLTRSRTRRGINGNASEWIGAVEGLPAVHARLQPVVVENMDALKLIPREDGPDTFQYLDPPYPHSTRTTKDGYACEMTNDQHEQLLDILSRLKGKFLLSSYHSPMYDAAAKQHGWHFLDIDQPNHTAGGDTKRRMVEALFANYPLPE